MKKIQKLIYVFLFSMLIVIGCKREPLTENSKNKQQVAAEGSKTSANSSIIIYKATEAEIAAAKNAWLSNARSKKGNVLFKGSCGEHISDLILIDQITGGCSAGPWDITYFIYSYDWVGSEYEATPVSAIFNEMYFGLPITGTLLGQTAYLVDPFCQAWLWDGYCEMVRAYHYEFIDIPSPASAWPPDIGDFSLGLRSGFSSNCTPITVSGDLKGGFTGAEYAAMLARVTVTPFNPSGTIFIRTDCSYTCPQPNIVCPTDGTLTYWPLSNPNNTTQLSISSNGNIYGGIPTGVSYGWSAVLNYTIGGNNYTSLPKTGTFTL